jgi:hypothetical protein
MAAAWRIDSMNPISRVGKIARQCTHDARGAAQFCPRAHPERQNAWATRRYAMPRIQRCGDGALPTLQIAPAA